jgi:hypothetical protein
MVNFAQKLEFCEKSASRQLTGVRKGIWLVWSQLCGRSVLHNQPLIIFPEEHYQVVVLNGLFTFILRIRSVVVGEGIRACDCETT